MADEGREKKDCQININSNNMNATSPKEMTSGTSKIEDAISKFEEQFFKQEKDQNYYHLVISGEYNRETCDEVERVYANAGWENVRCITSSENGERGGLTGLRMYRPKY